MFKKVMLTTVVGCLFAVGAPLAQADNYKIDTEGQHAFINFRISHLGYSWIYGDFKKFSGDFVFDKSKPANDKVSVVIDTKSVDTNHEKRDNHIRSADFLNVEKFPEAKFVSTKVVPTKGNDFDIQGNLTLNGVTKPVTIKAQFVGEGKDPWGGYRAGFHGTTTFKLKDFNISTAPIGEVSEVVYMDLSVEGVRQK